MNPREQESQDPCVDALTRTDWDEMLGLLERKSNQKKFKIIEAFIELMAELGINKISHVEIANKCRVSRQLVDHHFPKDETLLSVAYQYVYAHFQKWATDGIQARKGAYHQACGYIDSVASWVVEKRDYARFLVQFFALLPAAQEFQKLHDRNIKIGQDRIVSLCLNGQREGKLMAGSLSTLRIRAASLQTVMAGFVTLYSVKSKAAVTDEVKDEFHRTCLQILGFKN